MVIPLRTGIVPESPLCSRANSWHRKGAQHLIKNPPMCVYNTQTHTSRHTHQAESDKRNEGSLGGLRTEDLGLEGPEGSRPAHGLREREGASPDPGQQAQHRHHGQPPGGAGPILCASPQPGLLGPLTQGRKAPLLALCSQPLPTTEAWQNPRVSQTPGVHHVFIEEQKFV